MKKLAVAMALFAAGCGNTTGPGEQGTPLDALTALEEAYCARDTEAFAVVLQEGFFHTIPEQDWDDYNGDGIVETGWNAEVQVHWTGVFFQGCSMIDLSIDTENASVQYLSADEALVTFDFRLEFTGTGPDYIKNEGTWELLVSSESGGDWKLLEASDALGWVGFIP